MTPGPVSIEVILPCLDEVASLPWVLSRMPAGCDPIVVDNGSRDGSAEVAAAYGAKVIRATQRGYGAACQAGILAATADVVVVMDADSSLDPDQLPRVLAPVIDGSADLVVGRRRPVGRGAFPWALRLANRELARRVRRRTGVELTDLGPIRAARRERLLALDLTDRRSGYPVETVVRAAEAGWRIAAIEVDYFARRGRSKVTGTPWGAWRAVRDMSSALASAGRAQ
jgi:glycosyltransferase involved in cell wall biosynthesis